MSDTANYNGGFDWSELVIAIIVLGVVVYLGVKLIHHAVGA